MARKKFDVPPDVTTPSGRVVSVPTASAAKGDLAVYDGSEWKRLAVGTNTHVLTADSAQTLGVKWAAGGSGGNLDDLADVNAASPSDGDVLTYDSGTGDWINEAPGGSSDPEYYEWTVWERKAAPNQNALATSNNPRGYTGSGSTAANNDSDGAYLSHTTSAVSGNSAGQTVTNFDTTNRDWLPVYVTHTKTGASVADVRLWCGFFSGSPVASADPAVHMVAFRFDTGAGDTQWMAVAKDGSTINATATGVTPATGTKYVLRIACGASDVKYYINGTLVHTGSSNLPTGSQDMGEAWHITTLAAAAKTWNFASMRMAHKQ